MTLDDKTRNAVERAEKLAFTYAFSAGFKIADETSRSCITALDDAWDEFCAIRKEDEDSITQVDREAAKSLSDLLYAHHVIKYDPAAAQRCAEKAMRDHRFAHTALARPTIVEEAITQADRDAAADLLHEVAGLVGHNGLGQVADLIRDGEYDDHVATETMYQHRISHSKDIVVPEGWCLVPMEPTEEMLAKGAQMHNDMLTLTDNSKHDAAEIWAIMIAAAPLPNKE